MAWTSPACGLQRKCGQFVHSICNRVYRMGKYRIKAEINRQQQALLRQNRCIVCMRPLLALFIGTFSRVSYHLSRLNYFSLVSQFELGNITTPVLRRGKQSTCVINRKVTGQFALQIGCLLQLQLLRAVVGKNNQCRAIGRTHFLRCVKVISTLTPGEVRRVHTSCHQAGLGQCASFQIDASGVDTLAFGRHPAKIVAVAANVKFKA